LADYDAAVRAGFLKRPLACFGAQGRLEDALEDCDAAVRAEFL
jgi:hypothetical protein